MLAAVAALDEHMRCFPAAVQPDTICPVTDVAGKQLPVDAATVLPAAGPDLGAGSVPGRL